MQKSTSKTKTLVLSASDIEEIVREVGIDDIMDALIVDMRIAFTNFDAEKTTIPTRSGFNYEHPQQGLIEWMPLFDKEENQVVVKMVGYHPNNPNNFELPTIVSTISSYDTQTGHLKGIMDGVFLTALRTGAASAIASQVMANPKSSVLGLIGCGAQSVTQLHAISRIFKLKKVFYYDKDPETNASFLDRVAMLNLQVEFIPTNIEEIVRLSDIVTTATSIDIGEGPLFKEIITKDWLHINAVGSDFPGKTELPLAHLKNSFVSPDFLEQAIVEGECQQLEHEEIGVVFFECIKNPKKYQAIRNQRTVFDSTGLPLEDQVVMDLFLAYAEKMGLGQEISIEKISADAKSPYDFMYLKEAIIVKEPLPIESYNGGSVPAKPSSEKNK